jgi:hypothetical protein
MKEKKDGSILSIDERVNLFKEWLEDGGIETIYNKELLEDLMRVKSDNNGRVIPETVSALVNAALLSYEKTELLPPFESEKYISEYSSILQKSQYFDQLNVDTIEQFDELYEDFKNEKGFLFRGVNEAKWRLYSSLQRHWVANKLFESDVTYQGFLENLVDNARKEQKQVLSKFLHLNRIDPENDIAVLSFLQHNGCPTPLLDWTYSFPNSLYFALDKIINKESPKEIDNYFSVYQIEEKYFQYTCIKKIIEVQLEGEYEKLEAKLIENCLKVGVAKDQALKIFTKNILQRMTKMLFGKKRVTYFTRIKQLMKNPFTYFSDFDNEGGLQFSLNNNMNIVNQYGALTWNSNPAKPLEQLFNEQMAEELGIADGVCFCNCYNINKKLIPHINKRLVEQGVVKDFIYPNHSHIAMSSFEKTLESKKK